MKNRALKSWASKSWALTFTTGVILAGLLQSAALGWMVFDRVSLLSNGREVVLQTVPVDPRDLFRGDYVILNYEASSLKLDELEGEQNFTRWESAYVVFEKRQMGIWHPVGVHNNIPQVKPSQAVIKSTVKYVSNLKGAKTIEVDYGAGKLFVPEGEGKALEKQVSAGDVHVVLAVAADGEAAVKALIINGKRVYEDKLF